MCLEMGEPQNGAFPLVPLTTTQKGIPLHDTRPDLLLTPTCPQQPSGSPSKGAGFGIYSGTGLRI